MSAPLNPKTVIMGGLPITALSRRDYASLMVQMCRSKPSVPKIIISVNGRVLAESRKDPSFKRVLEQADALNPDGQSVVIASRLLTRTPLPERVATTDLFHDVARAAEAEGLRLYLLASTEEKLSIAVKEIRKLYPKLTIAGSRNGYFKPEEEAAICRDIVNAGTDILFVGFGVPKQEFFVMRHREDLKGVGCIKTCGGLFDYFSPSIKRAPAWMQRFALEWLFRTLQEPRRFFWRYFTTNGVAFWMLLTRSRDVAR